MSTDLGKNCFVIMPISTPAEIASQYGDADHFKHVLDCLFRPAIQKAGLRPISPSVEGEHLIHVRRQLLLRISDN